MIINELLMQMGISKYGLAKMTGIPYMTINDICNGKTSIKKCTVETVYKIAKTLNVTVEYLIETKSEKRIDFDLFKSNVCHRLKELGDIDFLIDLLESEQIRRYERLKWYPECLYLLGMLDYISRINHIALCEDFDDLRHLKLNRVVYPTSVIMMDRVIIDRDIKAKAFNESIPEFRRFNIVESEVRNVI